MTRNEAKMVLELIRDRYSSVDVDRLSLTDAETDAINMAIEALEQPYGKWYSYTRFRMNNWEGGYGCTCCKEWSAKESNYCPNCGADMRGDEDGV